MAALYHVGIMVLLLGLFASCIDLQVLAEDAPVECAEYTERSGECTKGNKIASQGLTNLDACKKNCGKDPACRGFNFVSGFLASSCDFMSAQCEDGELSLSGNVKTYSKTCPLGPLSNYYLRTGECLGNDIKKLTVDVTAQGCAQECDSLPECKAFLYKTDPNVHCWLKNNACPILISIPKLLYGKHHFYTKQAVPVFTTATPATSPTTPATTVAPVKTNPTTSSVTATTAAPVEQNPTKAAATTSPKTATNLALKRPAGQSSVYIDFGADLAVDGDRNPYHNNGSCSHMGNDLNPWWYVDLGTETSIRTVVIANRQPSAGRLANFDVKLSNTAPPGGLSGATVCFHQNEPAKDGEVLTIPCQGSGRYVIVQTLRTGYLSLCEVEVYVEDFNAMTVAPTEPNPTTAASTTSSIEPMSTANPTTATTATTEIPSPSPTKASFFNSPWWVLLGPTNETNPENLKGISLSKSNTNMTSGPEGLNAWEFGDEGPNIRSSVRVNSNGAFDFGDDSWTLATFLNPGSLKDGSIVEWEGDVQNTNGNQFGIKNGKLQATLVRPDGTETTYPFKAPSLKTWQFVGVSYNSETGALSTWIDDHISKKDVGKVTTDMKGDLIMGNRPNGPDGMEQLRGKLAGMTMVNYAITPPVETAELRRQIIGTAKPAAGDLIVDEWNNRTALIAGLVCGLLLLLLLVLLIICCRCCCHWKKRKDCGKCAEEYEQQPVASNEPVVVTTVKTTTYTVKEAEL